MEREKRMRKQIFVVLVVFLVSIAFGGCEKENEKYDFGQFDREAIITALKQSSTPDHGFRFATAEFKNNISVYASFYINSAKKIYNQKGEENRVNREEQLGLLNKTLSASSIDLTDLYCAVSLIEDKNTISAVQKEVIENYLHSLYLSERGCYSMPKLADDAGLELYIYPTYLVEKIAAFFDFKLDPIDAYLQKVSQYLFEDSDLCRDNSGAYSLLLQLLNINKINIPTSHVDRVLSMFESDLDAIDSLVNREDIYYPEYFLDYKEICRIAEYDNAYYDNIIIDSLCDESTVREGVIYPYDSYGLYAVFRTLELSNFQFETLSEPPLIFEDFDAFHLKNGVYIAPGETSSDFVDTYYAGLIINCLDIDMEFDLSAYCKINQEEIIESDVVTVCYFLEMLQRNNLLNVTISQKDSEKLAETFETTLNWLFAEENVNQQYLPIINASIKAIEMISGRYVVDNTAINKVTSNFTIYSDPQQAVYDLCELIDFLITANLDEQELLGQYCSQLAKELTALSDSTCSNKLMLFYEAFSLFEKCEYTVPKTLMTAADKLLSNSQSKYGLYRGGDSDEDVESFRNTYYGIILSDIIRQFRKA